MMHCLAGRSVTKMNGLGNQIAILDLRDTPCAIDPATVRAIGRADKLAFDQLMVLHAPRTAGTDAFVQIFNADGSEAGACGNGTRCVAWYLLHDTSRDRLTLETKAGALHCWRDDEWRFSVDMGRPRLAWQEIPLAEPVADTRAIALSLAADVPPVFAAVNMGNPHAIFFVDDLGAYDLAQIGPKLERHPLFPERANISFAEVVAPGHIRVRVFERGTGLTRACGSAACATLVAAVRQGRASRTATVSLPGGDLAITWREDDHVIMAGPVEWEFARVLDAALFEGAAA